MNDDKISSNSSENSFQKNQPEFKFKRQNDRALTNINSGREIWYFKNEMLKDMKILEKTLTDKFKSANLDLKDEINALSQNIKTLNIKIMEISTKITEDNSIKEKIENFDNVKNKLFDNILINDMKVNNLDKEIRQSIVDMNNTLRETVIYAGVIGPSCKFKTFHEFIDFVINQLNIFGTFKEKNMMDLNSFKKKIDSSVQSFKMKLDNYVKSSTEFVMDSHKKIDKNMNNLFHEYDDKINNIKNDFDEKAKNTDKKIEDFENKLINEMNEIKNKIAILEDNMDIHLKSFYNFKEEIKKSLNDNKTKSGFKRNSMIKNIETNNANLNKNKFNKRRSTIRNNKNEEIKNNNTNNTENTINNMNEDINQIVKEIKEQNIHTGEDNKENKNITTNLAKDKKGENNKNLNDGPEINNLNKNINIQVENSNSIDLNKYIEEKINKVKNYERSYDYNNKNLILSRLEKDDENIISFSPKRTSIRIKNMKNTFNISNNSNELANSKLSLKSNDNINNFEAIKPINILNESQNKKEKEKEKGKEKEAEKVNINTKTPNTVKNIFNKNIKSFKEQNKLFLLDKNKRHYKRQNSINNIKSLNIETNNNKKFQNILNDRYNLNYPKANKTSAQFKNIILTLEGTKKMIYETKDFTKGKNLYHIETLSDKNRKKSYLRERLESCKPFLLKKYYEKNMNIFYPIGKGEPFDFINYKKHRLLLNKSASSNVNIKNKDKNSNDYGYNTINANNYSPSLNITKYNFTNKKRYKSFGEEKSFQTEKN